MSKSDPNSGCYQLIIRLHRRTRIKVGMLGVIEFRPGYYIYTGRAKKNLAQRVTRHRQKEKKLRWHVDYLLVKGDVIDVLIYPGRLDECGLNAGLYKELRKPEWVAGFGSSDCRCRSHLIYSESKPVYDKKAVSG